MEQPTSAEPPRKKQTPAPLWAIPLAGVVVVGCCLLKWGKFYRLQVDSGVPIAVGLACAFLLGCAAAVPLTFASWIESEFWSGVVLWGGVLMVTLLVCAASMMLS